MDILSWIGVGKLSAELDDQLHNYFYDNGVLSKVIDENSSFLVLGRKGAGKTAVFKYISEQSQKFIGKDSVLVPLSFENYNWNIHSLLCHKESASSLAYKQSWRFVILVEVIKAYSQRFHESGSDLPKPLKKARALLAKLFGEPLPSIYNIIGKKLLSLSSFRLPSIGFDIEDGDFGGVDASGGEVSFESVRDDESLQSVLSNNIENIINFLDEAVRSIQIEGRVFLVFDRVDEAWDEISVDSSKTVIAGLISASNSITNQYRGSVRPIIFLREDIFNVLSLNDTNKLREDCGALLYWDRDALFRLILMRINYFATRNNVSVVTDIDSIFDKKEMRQRSSPSGYLLKRTMMRPRDLICFLGKSIAQMKDVAKDPFSESVKEFTQLSAEAVYEAEPSYSQWLKQEVVDEWKVQKPIITTLLDAIQNHGSTNITCNELISEMQKIGYPLNRAEALELLRFMFDNSIVGFKVGAGNYWRHKCFYPTQGFLEADEYRVHEGLVKALNLKEPRKQEEQS